jgi:PAS domain S-box-containing protein
MNSDPTAPPTIDPSAAIRASEERLAGAFEHAPIGVALLSPDGRFLRVNRALCELVGYTEAELMARTFQDITHPEDVGPDLANVRRIISGEIAAFQMEKRYLHARGHAVAVMLNVSLVRDRQGEPSYFISHVQDITERKRGEAAVTERKRAEEALRASEAEFRTLAEAMPQIVWITRADGWVLYFNQRWMDYTGLTLEQSLGEGWTEPFHPQDRQRSWDAWSLATRTQGTYSLECRMRRADGEYRWWLTRGAPQRDAAGHVLKWFGTCTDIHDLKMAQESLRLLGSAVEQASESVMITDAELAPPGPQIVFVNPAFTRMTGWASEEVIGKTPRILQGAGTDRAVLDRLLHDLQHDQVFQGEAVNYRKDGSEFALEWQVAPLRGADGTVTNYLAIQRDISDRKRAEAELAAAHAQLVTTSRLAGMAEIATNVLHNVGNVLNSVNVSASLMQGSMRESRVANLGKVAQLLQENAQDLGAFLVADALGRRLPEYIGQLAQHLQDEQQKAGRELDSLLHNIDHIKTIVAMQQDHAKGAGAGAAA